MKRLSNLDLDGNELQNAAIHKLATAPSSPVVGQVYYDTGDDTIYVWDGADWIDLVTATAADATTASKGIVQLAGDLGGAGTAAAAPVISAGAVTAGKVADALKPSQGAAAGTESLRALGTSAATALAGDTRLDQIAAPTASVALNSQKITGLADPTAAQDAATKAYVDATAQGLDAKQSVRAATTAAGTLASDFENGDTIDGVALATGNRILVKDQAAPAENGIYVVNASGAPTRASDLDTWADVPGAYVFVEEGTTNADSGWVSTADAGGNINSSAMPWAQFSGAGQITAGNALTKTGNTLDVAVDNSSVEVSGDALRVKADGITEAMLADDSVDLDDSQGTVTGTLGLGNGGTGQTTAKAARETGLGAAGYYSSATHAAGTSIAIAQSTHGLRASKGLIVQVQEESDGSVIECDVAVAGSGDVTVSFAASQSANSKRVTIIG
jgi:hypothetical protein